VGRAAEAGGPGHSVSEFAFGPYRLLPARQLLLQGEAPVRLGSRARELLHALVERAGEVVSKDALTARLWPNINVEEATLRVHVAALRKALGDGQNGQRFITSVPGRGYCFVADVTRRKDDEASASVPPVSVSLPSASRLFGRSEIIDSLSTELEQRRTITIVGAGGIGKTAVALAIADRLRGHMRDGVCFVDLAPLTDQRFVPTALASALGLGVIADHPLPGLIAALRDREIVILLDNCEHVIEAAAQLAEAVVKGAARTRVLATSREPLGVENEKVCRLAPLCAPEPAPELTAATAMTFPAVQLFVERVAMRLDGFALSDADAPTVASICRRLDGIALAIEIAAGHIDAFGVASLDGVLHDRFRLAMRGRRTAMPRQRTLSMTLDWSYQLLPETERVVLRRLAVFAGSFTMNNATALLADVPEANSEIVEAVASLVEKSLLQASLGTAVAYRLLDTTRAYAGQKLIEAGEYLSFARRHARYYQMVLEAANAEWEILPAAEWLGRYRHVADNARTALDWSLSIPEEAKTATALTVATVPLWFQLSLLSECCGRTQQTLALPAASRNLEQDLRLHAALAWSLMQIKGSVQETQAAWIGLLARARALGNTDYQLRALWGLWAAHINSGSFRPALALAEEFSALALEGSSKSDRAVGDRLVGYSLHLLGEQTVARRHIERMLAEYVRPVTGAEMIRFVFDQQATAQCFLARIQWLEGFPDKAMRTARAVVEATEASGDALSLCQVLVQAACPVGLFVGDLTTVQRHVATLIEASTRNDWQFWYAYGQCFQGVLLIRQGEVAAGLGLLDKALSGLRSIEFGVYYIYFLAEFASALGDVGEVDHGLAVADQALARSGANHELWYVAELLRIKGELLARKGAALEAEATYRAAQEWAERQSALSWSLRVATSMARLWQSQDRNVEAREYLTSVFDAFTEGSDTADHKAAKAILARLEPGPSAGRPRRPSR
jgi:predicted ATPase/DNA-binding winged helix-turn-helix (wHTH) protein